MNARPLTALAALTLSVFCASVGSADEGEALLAWQEPGYVMEVVIATAPRPKMATEAEAGEAATLAWQEPGYVEEVVIVTASRSEALQRQAARRAMFRQLLESSPFLGTPRD